MVSYMPKAYNILVTTTANGINVVGQPKILIEYDAQVFVKTL